MIKNKLNLLILLLLFLTSCGYEPIYVSKNLNFTIQDIKKQNTRINNEFESLIRSRDIPDNENKINLNIETEKTKTVKSKDKKGKALIYELNIQLVLSINKSGKNLETKVLSEVSLIITMKTNLN